MAYILASLLLLGSWMFAQDYGKYGHTFTIVEECLLDYLKTRLQSLTQNEHDLIHQKMHQKMKNHYEQSLTHPNPIESLKKSQSYTVHYFDPTIVSKQEIKDSHGNIVIAKGATYNPLQHVSLPADLLFFDGDDPTHITWAKSFTTSTKWILVAGHPLELEQKENCPVYFDRNGFITGKLRITQIPARVSQEDFSLKIETFPLVGRE